MGVTPRRRRTPMPHFRSRWLLLFGYALYIVVAIIGAAYVVRALV